MGKKFSRKDLYDWSGQNQMLALSKEYNISDVGFKKNRAIG